MTWIKLHDNVPRHPKIAGLSDRAFRWWIMALCYASEFLTDGVLPWVFLERVPQKVSRELVEAGLWRAGGGRMTIHDYLNHQSSKAAVEGERGRNADRQAAWRARNGVTNGGGHGERNGERNDEITEPEIRDQRTRDSPPYPPVATGGIRVRREHRQQAKAVLKARLGYCEHERPCLHQAACLELIAHEIAIKASV